MELFRKTRTHFGKKKNCSKMWYQENINIKEVELKKDK